MSDAVETEQDITNSTTEKVEALSMIFNVEDGTCVSGANSYISLEEADQFQANKNRTDWAALSEEERKAALVKGTQYIDALYTWKGRRKFERQELSFPRVMIRDYDGFEVKGVPRKIKEAVCEAAYYGMLAETELFTTNNENGAVKRQKVDGAVEVEFFSSEETAVDWISKYAALDSILRGLYIPKNGDVRPSFARVHWRH